MKRNFESLAEFLQVKEDCPFCKSKLKVVFINFSRARNDIPIIKAKPKIDKFSFILKHITGAFELEVETEIDIKTNDLKFFIPNKAQPSVKVMDYFIARQVFENLGPHVELYCSSRKCKMKYCICSDIFKLTKLGLPDTLVVPTSNTFRIKPFRLYMESFVMPKLWIQNDWIFNSTSIYSNKKESAPIKTKLLNLEEMGKDKVIKRINTLVTFS